MNKILKISLWFLGAALITLFIFLLISYTTKKNDSNYNSQEYQVLLNNMLAAFDSLNMQPGYIVFSFTEDTTKEQAEAILNKYGLEIEEKQICSEILDPGQPPRQGDCRTASDWVELVKIATVKVPVGEEKEYAKRVLENEIQVVSAEPKYQDAVGA